MNRYEIIVPDQFTDEIEADHMFVKDCGSIIFCAGGFDAYDDDCLIIAVYPSNCIAKKVIKP